MLAIAVCDSPLSCAIQISFFSPHLWLPTASSARSQMPEKTAESVSAPLWQACWGRCAPTWMLAKVVCGASRMRSLSFCCAALSAARSLPGARLSATGLSDELDSASERRQSELVGKKTAQLCFRVKKWRNFACEHPSKRGGCAFATPACLLLVGGLTAT